MELLAQVQMPLVVLEKEVLLYLGCQLVLEILLFLLEVAEVLVVTHHLAIQVEMAVEAIIH